MWWNFVGRSHEEIAEARADWAEGRRFGVVNGYPGEPLPAPALPTTRLLPAARAAWRAHDPEPVPGHRTGGPTHHELGRSPNRAGGLPATTASSRSGGNPALAEEVLTDRRQGRVGVRGLVDPVEADHRQVARHRDTERRRRRPGHPGRGCR